MRHRFASLWDRDADMLNNVSALNRFKARYGLTVVTQPSLKTDVQQELIAAVHHYLLDNWPRLMSTFPVKDEGTTCERVLRVLDMVRKHIQHDAEDVLLSYMEVGSSLGYEPLLQEAAAAEQERLRKDAEKNAKIKAEKKAEKEQAATVKYWRCCQFEKQKFKT